MARAFKIISVLKHGSLSDLKTQARSKLGGEV